MRKIFFIFIFTALFFKLINHPAAALEEFTKYDQNPLQVDNVYPNWQEQFGFEPHVIFDKSEYKMWYASFNGRFKIANATSADGIKWKANQLYEFRPGFDNHDPFMFKKDDNYTMFFGTSEGGGFRNFEIYKINSADGVTFDQSTLTRVLAPSEYWERTGVANPFVYYKDGAYFLFYIASSPTNDWSIGLATSTDGISWNKCQNNPILFNASSPVLFEKGNISYLLFSSGLGVERLETNQPLTCTTSWSNRQVVVKNGTTYDSRALNSPSIVENNNRLSLYYSAMSSTGKWTFNLASTGAPDPQKEIYVLVPGLLGSWNKEAILHNLNVPQSSWKLSSFVSDYDGIIKTFKKIGFVEGQNFFIFPYDWRKPINQSAAELATFLPADVKINLIGHSLGGLVGRSFAQAHPERVGKIVTVGTPHKGTAQVYKPLEGGELDRWNDLLWLSEKIILTLNKTGIETDRATITKRLPVLFDLFPTYDFLIANNGITTPHSSLSIKNTTLNNLDRTFPALFPNLITIAGEKADTVFSYQIIPPSNTDKLLDLYPDGKPFKSFNQIGDYVITSYSAGVGTNIQKATEDHGELIYSKKGIGRILDALQISYNSDQIVASAATKISPALFFFVQSPVEITVTDPQGQSYNETDGFIYIPNPIVGKYLLKAKGISIGDYRITIGKITNSDDSWDTISGKINRNPPSSQTDSYTINFQNKLSTPKLFDELIAFIHNIYLKKADRKKAILNYMITIKNNLMSSDLNHLHHALLNLDNEFASLIIIDNRDSLFNISKAFSLLENFYQTIFYGQIFETKTILQTHLNKLSHKIDKKAEFLLQKQEKGVDISYEKQIFSQLLSPRLSEAKAELELNKLLRAEIIIHSIKSVSDY